MNLPANVAWVSAWLCACVVGSGWLAKHTPARHLGTALLVLLVGAAVSNLGIIPTNSSAAAPMPAYDFVFHWIAPISIFWLLLDVDLRALKKLGLPMIGAFALGAVGTSLGVVAGMSLVGGAEVFGELHGPLGGMFAATYTGGSLNFNAVALHFDVVEEGPIYMGAIASDNIVTTIWMVATLAAPRALDRFWPRSRAERTTVEAPEELDDPDAARVTPAELAALMTMGVAACLVGEAVAGASERVLAESFGVDAAIPSILVVTTLALVCAQVPFVARMRSARTLGMFAVLVFLTVIGAHCDLAALRELELLGPRIFGLALVVVAVHGACTFGLGRLLGIDLDVLAVASQANVGGGTTALAVARSLRRADLVLPGILIGSVGTAAGTFVGFWIAAVL